MADADVPSIIGKLNKNYYDSYEKKPKPAWQQQLVYDSFSDTLEPLYFWMLDMSEKFGFKVEKIVDNFSASPGSGYYAELGARATRMQEEGMKILGSVNTVIKSTVNIIYDLKEFEIRLKQYDLAKSKDKDKRQAGLLGLKQIWIDNVDIKRGAGSINRLTYEFSFTTLRDAFMAADTPEDVDKLDLNDRVKRILKPRIAEFQEWAKRSEAELRKRYEIEKSYLKSQVSALRLYSRWAKPYLTAAEQLRMKETDSAHLVNAFNTLILQVSIFGKRKVDIREAAYNKQLPENFARYKPRREYYACVFVDFTFRGIPQRLQREGQYVFGGRSDVKFAAYALNDDELLLLKDELNKSDLNDALKLVETTTTESLDQLRQDIEYFLKEDKDRKIEEEAQQQEDDINPFAALFGFSKNRKSASAEKGKEASDEKRLAELKAHGLEPDSAKEQTIRRLVEVGASDACWNLFETYKKTHEMQGMPVDFDFYEYFYSKGKKGF